MCDFIQIYLRCTPHGWQPLKKWQKSNVFFSFLSSNYTNITVVNQSFYGLELEFYDGILFPDIIALNFSLTMDPAKERRIGSGEMMVSVVIAPVCQTAIHHGFPLLPANSTSFMGCGAYVTQSIGSIARGITDQCYH